MGEGSPKVVAISPVTKDANFNEDKAKDVSIDTEDIPEPPKQTNGIAGAECRVSTMDTTEMPNQKSDFEKSELWLGQSMENYFSHTTIAKPKTNMLVKADIIPRQKPKSGKFWKAERKQFNHVKKDKGPRLTFEQRLQRKEEQAKSKEIAEQIINNPNKIKRMKKKQLRMVAKRDTLDMKSSSN